MKKTLITMVMVLALIVINGCGQQNDTSVSDNVGKSISAVSIPSYQQSEIKDLETVVSTIEVADYVPTRIIKVKAVIGHEHTGDLRIELVSPQGQKHVLRERTEYNKNEDNLYIDISKDISSEFHAYDYRGTWKLEITDMQAGDEGYLIEWNLAFYDASCYGSTCGDTYLPGDTYIDNGSSNYYGGSSSSSSSSSSSTSPCWGVCSYGATCSDYCPSYGSCTGSYTNSGNLEWTVTSCGTYGW